MNRALASATIIAALGGLLFGFDTAVISGTTDALRDVFDLDSSFLGFQGFWLGFTVASALIGTIVGAMTAGLPADRLGRRSTLILIAVLYFVSAIGSALAWDWYSFIVFRFIGGLGVGGASVVSPMYIAEISPARLRGRLVAVTQFNICFGIMAAYFSNAAVAACDLGPYEWRWMFAVEAVPAAAFFLLLWLTPRSPRWLISQGFTDEARDVLAIVGTDSDSVSEEVQAIQVSLDLAHHSMREPFFRRKYLRPILLAVAIAAFNQLSGINAVLYYAPHVFKMAGASEASSLLQSSAIGFTVMIFTMIALTLIDHLGRKTLMIIGSLGYIASLGATAWAFYAYDVEFKAAMDSHNAVIQARASLATATGAEAVSNAEAALSAATDHADVTTASLGYGGVIILASLLLFIAAHAFGQGTVIWVFISEIFPNRVRARGQALGSFTHWFMAAVISQTFPMMADKSGGNAFAFYCAMMVLQLLWVLWIMPETRGIPLEQIQKKLGIE